VTLFISYTGLIAANSITGALHLFPEVAGSVSALVGAGQFGSGIWVRRSSAFLQTVPCGRWAARWLSSVLGARFAPCFWYVRRYMAEPGFANQSNNARVQWPST
jgi:DHA1 family bicyclomycin/chloramphenicol resistance-like MFS transporter